MGGWEPSPGTLLPVLVPAVVYGAARAELARRRVGWRWQRDLAFAAGLVCVLVALGSPLAAEDDRFPVHVGQHLLLGMAAPLGFALAAPVSLLLRASTRRLRRAETRVLRLPVARALGWAPVGAVLSVGLLWPLYLTGPYTAMLHHPVLHAAVHLHMLLAGCLFTFAVAGPDPIPGRGNWSVRVGAVAAAATAHAVLAKYLYAHAATLSSLNAGAVAQWRQGAQLLWYGGDLLDVALTVAVFARWYDARGRDLHRQRRFEGRAGPTLAGTRSPTPATPLPSAAGLAEPSGRVWPGQGQRAAVGRAVGDQPGGCGRLAGAAADDEAAVADGDPVAVSDQAHHPDRDVGGIGDLVHVPAEILIADSAGIGRETAHRKSLGQRTSQ